MATESSELPHAPTKEPAPGDPSTKVTVHVKFNVDNGSDRNEYPHVGFDYELEGQPKIQGITIGGDFDTVLKMWIGSPTGPPDKQIPGPTPKEVKIPSIRYASYHVERL